MSLKLEQVKKFKKSVIYAGIYLLSKRKKKSIVKEGQEWIAQRWALEYGSVHIVSLRM